MFDNMAKIVLENDLIEKINAENTLTVERLEKGGEMQVICSALNLA
jgi:hypothetical protein